MANRWRKIEDKGRKLYINKGIYHNIRYKMKKMLIFKENMEKIMYNVSLLKYILWIQLYFKKIYII